MSVAGYVIPNPRFKAFEQITNAPLALGKVYFYLTGTAQSVLQSVFAEIACTTPLANPVILDTNGEATIFGNAIYDIVITDANDVLQDTILGVSFAPGSSAASGSNSAEWIPQTGALTYISSTSFTIAGDQTAIFTPGRRIQVVVTAGTLYGTIKTSAYGTSTLVTVSLDSGNLDSGLSAVSVGIINATNTSLPVLALSTTTGGTTAYLLTAQNVQLLKGTRFQAIINATNTGASTLNANSTGVTTIKKYGAVALEAGDMQANAIHDFEFDGTNYQLLNPYVVNPAQLPSGTISGNSLSGIGSNNFARLASVEAASGDINLPTAGTWLIYASASLLLESGFGEIGQATLKIGGTTACVSTSTGNAGHWPSQGELFSVDGTVSYVAGAPGNVSVAVTGTGPGGGMMGTPVIQAWAIRIS